MELKGIKELAARLAEIERQAKADERRALYEVGVETQRVSMERTPVDTGALRGSHETTRPEEDGEGLKVTISVGGPSGSGKTMAGRDARGRFVKRGTPAGRDPSGYAVFVHEDLTAQHPVGQAKFLESAVMETRANMSERIAEKIAAFREAR